MNCEVASTLVIFQDRQWAGDPRLGSFTVNIDGESGLDGQTVGKVTVRGELALRVPPGCHGVRVRQLWYSSPWLDVDIPPGQTVRLRADVDKTGGAVRRVARALVRPCRYLALTPA